MNIFYLHKDPKVCAEQHLDKHVVKMLIEYAQLMSTAHRMLDGIKYIAKSKTGRKVTRYRLENKNEDSITAYRDYYVKYKKDFATWKTSIPEWYSKGINANI